jgi:hypothetical protein
LLATVTPAGGTPSFFECDLTGTRERYLLVFQDVRGGAGGDGYNINMRTSSNGGTTWDTGASDYNYAISNAPGLTTNTRATASACIIGLTVGENTGEGLTGEMRWENMGGGTAQRYIGQITQTAFNTVDVSCNQVSGRRNSSSRVNSVQIYNASGFNMAGTIKVYGWIE